MTYGMNAYRMPCPPGFVTSLWYAQYTLPYAVAV
jgi:hypothetical protein